MLTLEELEIKFADFLCEILFAITLQSFFQTECSFHKAKHISLLKQNVFNVDSGHTNPMLFNSIYTWYKFFMCAG